LACRPNIDVLRAHCRAALTGVDFSGFTGEPEPGEGVLDEDDQLYQSPITKAEIQEQALLVLQEHVYATVSLLLSVETEEKSTLSFGDIWSNKVLEVSKVQAGDAEPFSPPSTDDIDENANPTDVAKAAGTSDEEEGGDIDHGNDHRDHDNDHHHRSRTDSKEPTTHEHGAHVALGQSQGRAAVPLRRPRARQPRPRPTSPTRGSSGLRRRGAGGSFDGGVGVGSSGGFGGGGSGCGGGRRERKALRRSTGTEWSALTSADMDLPTFSQVVVGVIATTSAFAAAKQEGTAEIPLDALKYLFDK
jgi:uncharacterized membrane protein YgcG